MNIIKKWLKKFTDEGIISLYDDSPEIIDKKSEKYRGVMDYDGKRWREIMNIKL